MRILLLTVLCAFLYVLMPGCKSQRKALNSWVGHTKQSLIMQWGPPDRVDSDRGNGEVVIYAKEGYLPSDTTLYYDYVIFYLNSESRVYNWLTRREQIPPAQIDADAYRRD